ncbi:MAG: lysophospholipid acyltransferase family protein [Pseudomonadota bacterium]|jgi:1-acyl-sn-glycerol-3-phosphate acyltransferase
MSENNNLLSLVLRPWTLDLRTMRVLAGTAATIAVLTPPQSVLLTFAPRLCGPMPRFIHRTICRLIGVRVRTLGAPVQRGPVLYIANHMSWLDIPIIGSRVEGSFVARADMNEWGMFKYLCRLQRTIFVERDRRHRSMDQRDEIIDRLAANDQVILFPEGTTSNGNRLLPFKSALFSVAEAAIARGIDLKVQPVTLAYTRLNNIPMGRAMRAKLAWVGDEDLNPHFKKVLRLGRIEALLHFHQPVRPQDFACRKALAQHCEGVIGQSLRQANGGRACTAPDA